MHENSSLWLESPLIHTGTAHALQEAHHLLYILEDEFSRKTFFPCLKLPQKDAQLMSAAARSLGESCSPIFIFHKAEYSGEPARSQLLPVSERSCTMAAGSAHSRHCLQKLQECWLLRKEFLRNRPTPAVDVGPKRTCKTFQSCLSSTANNQQCTAF